MFKLSVLVAYIMLGQAQPQTVRYTSLQSFDTRAACEKAKPEAVNGLINQILVQISAQDGMSATVHVAECVQLPSRTPLDRAMNQIHRTFGEMIRQGGFGTMR